MLTHCGQQLVCPVAGLCKQRAEGLEQQHMHKTASLPSNQQQQHLHLCVLCAAGILRIVPDVA